MVRPIIFALLVALSFTLRAQTDSVAVKDNYLKQCWRDSKKIAVSPFHWEKKEWLTAGACVATTGALLLADEPVRRFVQDYRYHSLDDASKYVFEPLGKKYAVAVCGGFYAYGLLFKDTKSKQTGELAFESFALASLVVRVPKYLIGRKRPDSWDCKSAFDFGGPSDGKSFPSGHSTAAFAVATVIATQYKDVCWVPVASYSLATLVGLSRIYEDRHWISDVFVGAVIGTTIGKLISVSNQSRALSVIPFRTETISGLKLAYTF